MGLEWEDFYRDLPGADFTSMNLFLEQFLNLERFHNLAVNYRQLYGSSDAHKDVVQHNKNGPSAACVFCQRTRPDWNYGR
jgi:hypothetical protein